MIDIIVITIVIICWYLVLIIFRIYKGQALTLFMDYPNSSS